MPRALDGKRILVTGGTTGIGRATLKLLASEGARLLTFGRHEPELAEALDLARAAGADVHGLTADAASREDLHRVFDAVDERLGGLDILVVCAALGADPLHEMDEDAWRYVVDTNLVGCLACSHAAIARMKRQGGGHLLLVSSISPHIKAPGESLYAATKAGIGAFAETVRKEVAEHNIRISVVEPGSVGSDMQPCTPEEQRAAIARHEMLPAEQIAEAILFVLTRPDSCDVLNLRIEPRLQKTA